MARFYVVVPGNVLSSGWSALAGTVNCLVPYLDTLETSDRQWPVIPLPVIALPQSLPVWPVTLACLSQMQSQVSKGFCHLLQTNIFSYPSFYLGLAELLVLRGIQSYLALRGTRLHLQPHLRYLDSVSDSSFEAWLQILEEQVSLGSCRNSSLQEQQPHGIGIALYTLIFSLSAVLQSQHHSLLIISKSL